MSLLFLISTFACAPKSIDCDNVSTNGNDFYNIFLGGQNSSSPRALSLEVSSDKTGTLMNGYYLWSSVSFYQDAENKLAVYVTDSRPTTNQISSLGSDADIYNDLSDLGDLVGLYESSSAQMVNNSLSENGNNTTIIDANYLDHDRYITYVVAAGVSVNIDIDFGVSHCQTSMYEDGEISGSIQLIENWSY